MEICEGKSRKRKDVGLMERPEINKDKNSVAGILAFTADKLAQLSRENSVAETPIKSDNGSTVIPISDVSLGFAGGGMNMEDAKKKKIQNPAGAGGKVQKNPKAFLIFENNSVRIENICDGEKKNAAEGVVKIAAALAQKISEKKSEKQKP